MQVLIESIYFTSNKYIMRITIRGIEIKNE